MPFGFMICQRITLKPLISTNMAQIKPPFETFARIKVVGAGGSGGKVIYRMMQPKIHGVEFVAINLDAQDLNMTSAPTKILIGKNSTDSDKCHDNNNYDYD